MTATGTDHRASTPQALTIATAIAAAVLLLTACEPVEDPAAGQSADRAARDIGKDILTEPGDPPLIVTRVYRKGTSRCFEAHVEWRAGGEGHERFHRDCARPSDPADVRAYIARQRVGTPVKD